MDTNHILRQDMRLVVDSVVAILYSFACYTCRCPERGPKITHDLKSLIQCYNVVQIVMNSLLFGLSFYILSHEYEVTAWFSLHCFFPNGDPNYWLVNMPQLVEYHRILYAYYLSRYLDWIDTLILVLQGKQLNFLHV